MDKDISHKSCIENLEWLSLISDKIKGKKNVNRDKEGHFIIIKVSVYHDDITINIYVPNKQSPRMHKAQTVRNAGRNRQPKTNSWKS